MSLSNYIGILHRSYGREFYHCAQVTGHKSSWNVSLTTNECNQEVIHLKIHPFVLVRGENRRPFLCHKMTSLLYHMTLTWLPSPTVSELLFHHSYTEHWERWWKNPRRSSSTSSWPRATFHSTHSCFHAPCLGPNFTILNHISYIGNLSDVMVM